MTEKHKRNGNKKEILCNKCDYSGLTHWNLKLHKLSQHSTIEDRKNSKYYCKINSSFHRNYKLKVSYCSYICKIRFRTKAFAG